MICTGAKCWLMRRVICVAWLVSLIAPAAAAGDEPDSIIVSLDPHVSLETGSDLTFALVSLTARTEGYLFFGNQAPGDPIRISFPLKDQELTLRACHPRPIRVRLRGDAVTAMDNFDSRLTFFPPFEEPADP